MYASFERWLVSFHFFFHGFFDFVLFLLHAFWDSLDLNLFFFSPLLFVLCFLAILALKDTSLQCTSSCSSPKRKPVLEEFMSLNKDSSDENEKEEDCRDKKEWMSSVQLWKTDDFQNTQTKTKVHNDNTNSVIDVMCCSCIFCLKMK